MPQKYLIKLFAAAAMAAAIGVAGADTLSIAEKLNDGAVVPQRGMTMDMVERRFGSPNTRRLPVGDPPITRWIYDGFRVYFEHQYVIHSVAN